MRKNLDRSQVRKLAQNLAKEFAAKDTIIGLTGPLGAGKTAFAKDFAATYGIKKVKSPTFIIGSLYPIGNRTLYHYDFYRLNEIKQLEALDFEEILASKNRIVLIEWVEKFPQIAKQCDLIITFKIRGKFRDVKIT